MIDELTIYNMAVIYPNTVDLVREVERMARADVIYEIKKLLPQAYCNNCDQTSCDGGRVGSIQECTSVRLLIDTLFELEDELKEKKKFQ